MVLASSTGTNGRQGAACEVCTNRGMLVQSRCILFGALSSLVHALTACLPCTYRAGLLETIRTNKLKVDVVTYNVGIVALGKVRTLV